MEERGRDRLQRAKARANWPGGKYTLQDAPEVDVQDSREETPASWVRRGGFQS